MTFLNLPQIIPVYFFGIFVHSFLEPLIRDDFWNIKPRRKTSELTDFLWYGLEWFSPAWYYLVQAQIHWGFNSTRAKSLALSVLENELPACLAFFCLSHFENGAMCLQGIPLCKVLVLDAFDRFCIVSFCDYIFMFY